MPRQRQPRARRTTTGKIVQSCKIMADSNGVIVLHAPDDQEFLNDLLAAIPSDQRQRNEAQAKWLTSPDYIPTVIDLARKHFGNIQGLEDLLEDDYTVLGVSHELDTEAIEAVVKALRKKYHPDTTQDPQLKAEYTAKLQEIGEAWNSIKAERGV